MKFLILVLLSFSLHAETLTVTRPAAPTTRADPNNVVILDPDEIQGYWLYSNGERQTFILAPLSIFAPVELPAGTYSLQATTVDWDGRESGLSPAVTAILNGGVVTIIYPPSPMGAVTFTVE